MNELQQATIGGGCFWCTEAVYLALKGVEIVESGYSGGQTENPTYEHVSTGRTGHAEVIQITFNPEILSYEILLEIFFATHDPTTLNRQGADVGTQYRSIILYHNDEQKQTAYKIIQKQQSEYKDPIVTQLEPYTKFYKAEDYHQNYYENNRRQPYCRMVIDPKMQKFYGKYRDKLKK